MSYIKIKQYAAIDNNSWEKSIKKNKETNFIIHIIALIFFISVLLSLN